MRMRSKVQVRVQVRIREETSLNGEDQVWVKGLGQDLGILFRASEKNKKALGWWLTFKSGGLNRGGVDSVQIPIYTQSTNMYTICRTMSPIYAQSTHSHLLLLEF